jgi:cytochrome b561
MHWLRLLAFIGVYAAMNLKGWVPSRQTSTPRCHGVAVAPIVLAIT